MHKNSGSYGEKIPYTLKKNVSPSDQEISEDIQRSLQHQSAVTKNQNVYDAGEMDAE
jgi:hypothetical protein